MAVVRRKRSGEIRIAAPPPWPALQPEFRAGL
jgi:hypothetical protein